MSVQDVTGRIAAFVGQWKVRDLVERFDIEFDTPNLHQHCVGLLEMLGAFENKYSPDDVATAERVGAWWCRIITADTRLQWLDGLNAIEISRGDADHLRGQLLAGSCKTLELPDDERKFVAYVAARWHDGAGKILYRCGDFSGARLNFAAATQIGEREKLWYCLPDLQSNRLRGEFEERGQAAHHIRLDRRYRRIIREVEREALSRGVHLPWAVDSLTRPVCRLQCEFLRGLANLYHNLSVELMRIKDGGESLECSKRSEALCRLLADEYRLGQALNQQAFLALADNDHARARGIFEEVLTLRSERAQRIARQNLATIDDIEGHLPNAVDGLINLLDVLRGERNRYSDNVVFDTPLHFGTADRLGLLLERLRASKGVKPEEWKRLRKRQEEEYIEGLRAVRRVVKVAQYKRSFSTYHYPVFLSLIGKNVDRLSRTAHTKRYVDASEQTLALVEETSCRELLDLLGSGAIPVVSGVRLMETGPIPTEAEPDQRRGDTQRIRAAIPRRELSLDGRTDYKIRRALQVRQKYYEEQALASPIKTLPPDSEIGYELRMFSANNPGLTVVRYFLFSDGRGINISGSGKRRELAALVIRDGEIKTFQLDWARIQRLVVDDWSIITRDPRAITRQVGRDLYRLLIEPLWGEAGRGHEQKDYHLVLIPTDDLFSIPLHLAMPVDQPLCAIVPVSYSTSVTAFLRRGRHLLRRHRVEVDDDLCAVVFRDKQATGNELCDLEWSPGHLAIAGSPPPNIGQHTALGKADWKSLKQIAKLAPEYFLYSGHGVFYPEFATLGPALLMKTDVITQYDVAMRLRLPHNKLTLIGACVSGQGSYGGGGEVSGFLRAFIAAGAGALGVTLWPVRDEDIVKCIHTLLRQVRQAQTSGEKTFDIVTALFQHYKQVCADKGTPVERMEGCPIALYL